jgi:hypothetical protein
MCDFVGYDMGYNLRTRNKIAELEDEGLFVEEGTQQRRAAYRNDCYITRMKKYII